MRSSPCANSCPAHSHSRSMGVEATVLELRARRSAVRFSRRRTRSRATGRVTRVSRSIRNHVLALARAEGVTKLARPLRSISTGAPEPSCRPSSQRFAGGDASHRSSIVSNALLVAMHLALLLVFVVPVSWKVGALALRGLRPADVGRDRRVPPLLRASFLQDQPGVPVRSGRPSARRPCKTGRSGGRASTAATTRSPTAPGDLHSPVQRGF